MSLFPVVSSFSSIWVSRAGRRVSCPRRSHRMENNKDHAISGQPRFFSNLQRGYARRACLGRATVVANPTESTAEKSGVCAATSAPNHGARVSIHQPRRTLSLPPGAAELSVHSVMTSMAARTGVAAAIPPRLRLQSPPRQFYLDFAFEIEAVFKAAQTFQGTPAIEFASQSRLAIWPRSSSSQAAAVTRSAAIAQDQPAIT